MTLKEISIHVVMNHNESSMAWVAFKNLLANKHCLVVQNTKCLFTKAKADASCEVSMLTTSLEAILKSYKHSTKQLIKHVKRKQKEL